MQQRTLWALRERIAEALTKKGVVYKVRLTGGVCMCCVVIMVAHLLCVCMCCVVIMVAHLLCSLCSMI